MEAIFAVTSLYSVACFAPTTSYGAILGSQKGPMVRCRGNAADRGPMCDQQVAEEQVDS